MRTLCIAALLSSAVALADAEKVKKETAEAIGATKDYANEKKDEFVARIDTKLKTLKDDVTRLTLPVGEHQPARRRDRHLGLATQELQVRHRQRLTFIEPLHQHLQLGSRYAPLHRRVANLPALFGVEIVVAPRHLQQQLHH